jgi:hypothetical protein
MNNEQASDARPETAAPARRREFLKGMLAATAGVPLLSPALRAVAEGLPGNHGPLDATGATPSARRMASAVETFLSSLNATQRAAATYEMGNELRFDWNFRPRVRDVSLAGLDQEHLDFIKSLPAPKGISLKELTPAQRSVAEALLKTGLSPRGLDKATAIMAMSPLLLEVDPGNPAWDAAFYYVSVFGRAGSRQPWAWSFEGHHLSLNFTAVNGRLVASSPTFFGVYPAEVRQGPRKGLRVLRDEEDLARSLLTMLDLQQRSQAVVSESAPREIVSGVLRKASPLTPAGLQASRLGRQQAETLMKLLTVYAANMPAEVTARRLAQIKSAGFGNIYFAWAGAPEQGRPHYYRIQGPSFLIEYDNTQSRANHIHTVWRDFNGDFGHDQLANHYQTSHH